MNFHWFVIIAELWRPEIARGWKKIHLFAFWGKRHLTAKFSKFCSTRIHCDTDRRVVFKFREIWPTENLYKSRGLFTWQKIRHGSLCSRYCAECAQNPPGPTADNVLRMLLQISSKSFHFRLFRTREHRQSALESESNIRLKPSLEPNN